MTDTLSDLRRADAHARWRVAESLALRPEAAAHLADAPVHLAGWMDDDEDGEEIEYEVLGGVAIVPVVGALMDRAGWCWDGYDAIQARSEAAHADPSVRVVMYDFDSPGGMAAGLLDCMRALRAAKATSKKKCVAWVGSGAYSAAYGLASTCDEIVCSDTAGTGSVGVITSLTSVAKMLKEMGVDMRVISSGVEKTDGHPAVPISDSAEARVTARVHELAALFFAEVGAGRSALTVDALTALDGGVRYGRGAIAAGLADRISTRTALLSELQAAATARPIAPARGTTTGATRATRNSMTPELAAAIAAITGATDPEAQAAALSAQKAQLDAAGATITKLSADLSTANDRAAAAEKKLEAADRAHEVEAAKTEGKWSPALDGFLSTLSNDQLRAWRASAPRVVPGGQHDPPTDGPSPDAQLPADVAAIAAKAQTEGWGALSDREKHSLIVANKPLAQRLKAAAKNASTSA
jgi:ClpP class serine protease